MAAPLSDDGLDLLFRKARTYNGYLDRPIGGAHLRALGLDTGPMSGFDNAGVDAAFFAGTSYTSNFLSTLGYGDPSTIFERMPRPSFEEFTTIA